MAVLLTRFESHPPPAAVRRDPLISRSRLVAYSMFTRASMQPRSLDGFPPVVASEREHMPTCKHACMNRRTHALLCSRGS